MLKNKLIYLIEHFKRQYTYKKYYLLNQITEELHRRQIDNQALNVLKSLDK